MLTPQLFRRCAKRLWPHFALTTLRKELAVRREKDGVQPAGSGPLALTREWAMHGLMKLLRCEKGANAIEYALLASLIVIAAVAAFQNLGNNVDAMYNNVGNHL
jgi:pilus assembly protein Flp/PilA